VAATDKILLGEELEKDCKVAAQCRKVLQMLSLKGPETAEECREVVIPYFGAVIRKRSCHTQPNPRDESQAVGYNLNETASIPPPPPYYLADPTVGNPVVENPWSLNGFSLQYISHRGFDRGNLGGFMGAAEVSTQEESNLASAEMQLDPGWSVLTDINWDLTSGIDEVSPEDFDF
jgi:hypothetical protein